jgi:hypothetical protein
MRRTLRSSMSLRKSASQYADSARKIEWSVTPAPSYTAPPGVAPAQYVGACRYPTYGRLCVCRSKRVGKRALGHHGVRLPGRRGAGRGCPAPHPPLLQPPSRAAAHRRPPLAAHVHPPKPPASQPIMGPPHIVISPGCACPHACLCVPVSFLLPHCLSLSMYVRAGRA